MPLSVVLIEPDIPQNTGAIMRLCACLQVPLHLIEPFGFIWDEQKLKRGGLDYLDKVALFRHIDYDHFIADCKPRRRVLFTTHASEAIDNFSFTDDDFLLFGSESRGAPESIHATVDKKIKIPMADNTRSLNLATSIAFVLGAATRRTNHGAATIK
ncbi:MAG: tRNA (cytidine(34)-2'-O)-methyltransferase [Hydrotalea sp.]|nr:tRNA (cytidine(34)-2'-O)-methyltransferase [Hydrotalea sp.]